MFLQHVVSDVFKSNELFYIVSHSYGSLLTIELARLLERSGKTGKIIILDGGPAILRHMFNRHILDGNIYDIVLLQLALNIFPSELAKNELKQELDQCKSDDEKIQKFIEKSKHTIKTMDEKRIQRIIEGIANRIKSVENMEYFKLLPKIESTILLLRPLIGRIQGIAEDYELSMCTNGSITIDYIDGDHDTILNNPTLVSLINESCPAKML